MAGNHHSQHQHQWCLAGRHLSHSSWDQRLRAIDSPEHQTEETSLMAGLQSPSAFELSADEEAMGDKGNGWIYHAITFCVLIVGLLCSSFLYGYPPHITHAVH